MTSWPTPGARSPLLHDAGIRHGGITPDRLRVADGRVFLADFDRATIDWDDTSRQLDEAQLLTSTAVAVGADRAVAAASAALGVDRLTEMTTFVQAAAMMPALRRQAAAADLDIDDLRKATIAEAGAEEQQLQALHRISIGNIVMMALLVVVAYVLIGAIQSVGLSSIVDAIAAASLGILLLAFVLGQIPESPAHSPSRERHRCRSPLPDSRCSSSPSRSSTSPFPRPPLASLSTSASSNATDSTGPPRSASPGSTASVDSSPRSA